jgi:hypothetical protein
MVASGIRAADPELAADDHRCAGQPRSRTKAADDAKAVVVPVSVHAADDDEIGSPIECFPYEHLVRDAGPQVHDLMPRLFEEELKVYQIPDVRVRSSTCNEDPSADWIFRS